MIRFNGIELKQNHFPDNSLLLKFNPRDDQFGDNNGANLIEWFYESDAELFSIICIKRHLEKNFALNLVNLYLPYIPHARQDRVKTEEDIFTLKYFCDTINSLNFTSVAVLDPHSHVSSALLDRVHIIEPKKYIEQAIAAAQPDVIFFPDEGAMKRYDWVAVNKPRVFGIKNRNWETGEIKGLSIHGDVDALKNAKVLIIDDICSKGGTFYHSAKALRENGAAAIDLYVTHCEHTIFEGELLKSDLINRIYTTNSIFHKEHEKIEVFEV